MINDDQEVEGDEEVVVKLCWLLWRLPSVSFRVSPSSLVEGGSLLSVSSVVSAMDEARVEAGRVFVVRKEVASLLSFEYCDCSHCK